MIADAVVVWGNCQADPLADLLTAPLAASGLRVLRVPPVYLITDDQLGALRAELPRVRLLISQPVADTYPLAGCGTDQLAAQLPPAARVITLPVVFDVSAFPFMCHGHDLAGRRSDAPITDYHDLRAVTAAARAMTVEEAQAWWPRASPDATRAIHARSSAELRRRESGLTVPASPLLDGPAALWTMTHPSNAMLARLAGELLAATGLGGEIVVPAREYLGERRAPVDDGVAAALGWPDVTGRRDWVAQGRPVTLREILLAQLPFYAERPELVAGTLRREAARVRILGLG